MSERQAPEAKGLPVLGQLIDMRSDPLQLVVEMMCECGGLVRLKLGPRTVHLVTDPDCAQEVLQQKQKSFTKKTFGMAQLAKVVGNGLLTSDGEFWRRQRRIAQPAFHKKRLVGFAETMSAVALEVLESWQQIADGDGLVDIDREMMAATLRIVSRTLLSTDLSRDATDVAEALDYLLVDVRSRMLNPLQLPLAVPTPANVRFRRALETIDELLNRLIEERTSGRRTENDLLQMLVDAVDEESGEKMSAEQLRDEVATIFIAGHETTAAALSWTFYLLSQHPLARQKLWAELDSVLAGRHPELADLKKLEYLGRVLDESMRLYPPAWIIARQSCEEVEIGGYSIPDDNTVLVCAYAMHRSPELWDNPLGFDPDRFSDERSQSHHRYQYIPFGAGSRMCIGKGFALMETKLMLATLLQQFRVDLLPQHPVEVEAAVTLRPRDGIKMRLRRRA